MERFLLTSSDCVSFYKDWIFVAERSRLTSSDCIYYYKNWFFFWLQSVVSFEWLEECLKSGERLPEHKFAINYEEEFKPKKEGGAAGSGVLQSAKRSKISSDGPENRKETAGGNRESRDAIAHPNEDSDVVKGPSTCTSSQSASGDSKETIASQNAFKAEV